jgi:hypothetical protein
MLLQFDDCDKTWKQVVDRFDEETLQAIAPLITDGKPAADKSC